MKNTLRIGWILLCLMLGLAARCWNVRDVFLEGKIYFIDADCYSRMTRAKMVAEGGGFFIRHHDFENWPLGVTPHTTAPMDWLIVGLQKVLDGTVGQLPAFKVSVLANQTLDLAGGLISPLLGVAGILAMAIVLWRLDVRFSGIALLFYAVCPVLVHGTLLGRPDHQSLLILLLTVALGTELLLATSRKGRRITEEEEPHAKAQRRKEAEGEFDHRGSGGGLEAQDEAGIATSPLCAFASLREISAHRSLQVVNGLAWAVSLWVSLYEPLILLAAVGVLWITFAPLASLARGISAHRIRILVILTVTATAFALEGWRISVPDAALREYFPRWQHTIGELAHLDLRSPLLFAWLGWLAIASPVFLFLARRRDRRALPLLGLLLAVFALTIWQVRWGYFLAVVFAWTLPWQVQALRKAWIAWPVFLVSLWPMVQDWDQRLAAEDDSTQITMQRAEIVALRELVTSAMPQQLPVRGGFLAPWWLSPSIAYWTGQPGVAGSSHESLPGIVETARFYLGTNPQEAAAILRARKVRWVLADEPSREINTSATLLGITPPGEPLAKVLAERPDDAPAFLAEWKARPRADGLRFYRLYEVDETAMLPP